MANLLLLNVLDVGRALGLDPRRATPELVAQWLITEYAKRRAGKFNYNPATNTLYDLFRGMHTFDSAALYCMTKGNPKGREQNVAAIKMVAPYAIQNISTCYRIDFSAVAVGRVKGRTVYVAIKAPIVRVVHDEAFVVLPGFRMSYRPVETEIDVACSIALAHFARDDFAGADFEYLYAGPGVSGKREFRSIHGKDRKVFDKSEVDALLDVYVRGVGLAIDSGVDVREPSFRGYRIIDPREPTFFGGL